MYENEIIEFEDNDFNNYLNHFDECDVDYLEFNDKYECLEIAVECLEEIIWN